MADERFPALEDQAVLDCELACAGHAAAVAGFVVVAAAFCSGLLLGLAL